MKILVAEDDSYTRRGLVEVFESDGYQVIAAKDGREALSMYACEKPDFICMDIMMPGLNGYDVCREIRKQDSNVPILFISAKSEEIDKVVGLELGADDYIVKPFGVKEMLARVKAVARRYSASSGDNTRNFWLGDLEVAPAELRAYRDSIPVELSPRDVKPVTAEK